MNCEELFPLNILQRSLDLDSYHAGLNGVKTFNDNACIQEIQPNQTILKDYVALWNVQYT